MRKLVSLLLLSTTLGYAEEPRWTAKLIGELTGFSKPESVAVDPQTNLAYISNVNGEFWEDNAQGFISLVSKEGKLETLSWLASSETARVNAPKGMCLLGEHLYFTDNRRLMRCTLQPPQKLQEIVLPKTRKLNDLATDGKAVYVSDSKLNLIYRVRPDGRQLALVAPNGVNGLCCFRGNLFAVSWLEHEIYQIDPGGKTAPETFGLAQHFKGLDGIEVLDDGTFVVSDFAANRVMLVLNDRLTVQELLSSPSPADIGLDRARNLLYVPLASLNKIQIFQLSYGSAAP